MLVLISFYDSTEGRIQRQETGIHKVIEKRHALGGPLNEESGVLRVLKVRREINAVNLDNVG